MLVGTPNARAGTLQVVGIPGTGAASVVIELDDVQRFNEFAIQSSAGVMDALASLDGVNFTVPIAFEDKQSTAPGTRVLVTVAGGIYYFAGNFKALRIRQSGGVAVADPFLMCGQIGRD